MRAWENMGTERINLIVTYLEMYGEKPDWRESQAFIEYHIVKNQLVHQDDNGMFFPYRCILRKNNKSIW